MKTQPIWNFQNNYTLLPDIFYSYQSPTPVASPKLVFFNSSLANQLNLNLSEVSNEDIAQMLSGNTIPGEAKPIAQAYAGHQFGHFTILGDGRAILLGEHLDANNQLWDIQLKGSGRTPYSRRGDGRAALGPMLREYLMSEAMYFLGIPTTRSLAIVATGEPVVREEILPGSILTRVASSHLRVGTFEFIAYRNSLEGLQALTDYTIKRHYPHLVHHENPALGLLQAVMERQINLITHWMRVGFIHGVMNTDNMSISGETIDYGPCAFLNTYSPHRVFSSIDQYGRYSFGQQPAIAQWNLTRFAETLLPLLNENKEVAIKLATETVQSFVKLFNDSWMRMMRNKLGLFNEETEDQTMIINFLNWMEVNKKDYTLTFRALSTGLEKNHPVFEDSDFVKWHEQWKKRLARQSQSTTDSIQLMLSQNPIYIPRNHRVEEALQAATVDGNLTLFQRLLEVLSHPYQEKAEDQEYSTPPEIEHDENFQTFCGT